MVACIASGRFVRRTLWLDGKKFKELTTNNGRYRVRNYGTKGELEEWYGIWQNGKMGPFDGPYTKIGAQGAILAEGRYRTGTMHGCWVQRDLDNPNRKLTVGAYLRGKKDGNWLIKLSDGSTRIEGWDAGVLSQPRLGD